MPGMPGNNPDDFSLGAGFLYHALHSPRSAALHISDRLYTYGELLENVQTVHSQLIGNEALVGVYCTQSVWTYAAILAITISGKGYVPLNARFPAERLKKQAAFVGLTSIVTEAPLPFTTSAKTIVIDPDKRQPNRNPEAIPAKTAYVLFTSGTTGEPKAVPVSGRNLHAFFSHFSNNYDFNPGDRFLQPYELSFDVSVFSIFAAFNAGASVYVVPDSGFKYLNVLNTLIKHDITVCSMVPGLLIYIERYLDEVNLPKLKYSFFSGDRLLHSFAVKWQHAASHARIVNCYGPTETTIVCTSYDWDEIQSARDSRHDVVPLGKPFCGTEFLLREEDGTVTANGPAELCITGDQVISSYFNNTNEDNFFEHGGKRYYRTGDVTSLNENGNLVFHGRTDSQVKIDGYRVETAEIEAALSTISGRQCVVVPVAENNQPFLVAFIEGKADTNVIARQLVEQLPLYMHPREIVAVHRWPQNANGKTDKTALKETYHAGNTRAAE
jgi:D-alanine--poly(phosphoribitol) ligase subunit 1